MLEWGLSHRQTGHSVESCQARICLIWTCFPLPSALKKFAGFGDARRFRLLTSLKLIIHSFDCGWGRSALSTAIALLDGDVQLEPIPFLRSVNLLRNFSYRGVWIWTGDSPPRQSNSFFLDNEIPIRPDDADSRSSQGDMKRLHINILHKIRSFQN